MLELTPFGKISKYDFNLTCDVSRHESEFNLRYNLKGPINDLIIPQNSGGVPKRMNGLWETTCFEAFIKNSNYTPYLEFNFAPSGHWNAFIFSDYREAMREFTGIKKMHVELKSNDGELSLNCNLVMKRPKGFLESDFAEKKIKMGISAILHLKNDNKLSYALNHPLLKVDFHHEDGFIYKLL